MSETVLISGGTGLIGRHLCEKLQQRSYDVAILSRTNSEAEKFNSYYWDIKKSEIDIQAIAKADYIIHLAGTSIGEKRWTNKRKQEIIDSRIKSGQLIFDEVRKQNKQLKAFISSSAVGYYGTVTSSTIFKESDPPGNDFLGQTCHKWERCADKFQDAGIRTVKIRTGIVLSNLGGALNKMLIPIKLGFGSALGSGKQYIPWIHMDDLCNIYIKAIEDVKMIGPYNAVAPEDITNEAFTKSLAKVLHKKLWFPNVPSIAMKILFGQMADILLKGSRASAKKILAAGFTFKYANLDSALEHILNEKSNTK